VNRTYDARISLPETPPNYVEIKAGKPINGAQLAHDVKLASAGTKVDYVFAGNPITGNHGPERQVQTRLDNATTATNGRLTSTVADVESQPSSADPRARRWVARSAAVRL